MDEKVSMRYSNFVNRQTGGSGAFTGGIEAEKENNGVLNKYRDGTKGIEASDAAVDGSQQGPRRSSVSLLPRRGISPLVDGPGRFSSVDTGYPPVSGGYYSWKLRDVGRGGQEKEHSGLGDHASSSAEKITMTVESPRCHSEGENPTGDGGLVLLRREDQAEQLKHEVDILLSRKESLEREAMFAQEELNILLDQKNETKGELSGLMSEMETAREALEYLQLDLGKEEENVASHRHMVLSQIHSDAEKKKLECYKAISQERKALEEKQKEMELLRIRLEKKSLDIDTSERDLENRARRLETELTLLRDEKESFEDTMREREQSLLQRETECNELWERAQGVLLREKCVAEREDIVVRARSELHRKESEIEKLAKDVEQDKKILREHRMEFESQKRDAEVMKSLFTEQIEQEKLWVQEEKGLIAKKREELSSDEERLKGIETRVAEAERDESQLLTQIELSKRELQSLKDSILEEKQAYESIMKDKSEALCELQAEEESIRAQREDLVLRETKICEDRDSLLKETEELRARREDMEQQVEV